MPGHERINIKKVLEKNPHINTSDLKQYEEMKKDLQKLGFAAKGYRLATPYEKRSINTNDDFDPRTIDLSAAYE